MMRLLAASILPALLASSPALAQGWPDLRKVRDDLADLAPRAGAGAAGAQEGAVGLLIMAHGGEADWEAAVSSAAASLRRSLPTEVAFGMADPETIQAAVVRLEAAGAGRIAVVRLFISGDSFKDRTEKILGLKPGAPPRPEPGERPGGGHGHGGHPGHGHGDHDPDAMPLWRVESKASFAMSEAGLMDDDRMGEVLAKRACALSRDPSRESVLILGHGPGDDRENERWLARMDALAGAVRRAKAFREVRVETLREDWPERRRAAEERIRGFVAQGARIGRALVIPFRVHGFGPYAEVLKGLEYASDGKGLLPDPLVTDWMRDQASATAKKAGWR